jgi:hypothetical protein
MPPEPLPLWLPRAFSSLISALLAFWTARYSTGPEFAAVADRVQGTEAWIKWRFLPNLAEAIQANEVKLKRKNRLLMTALSALFVLVVYGRYLLYALL